MRCFPALNESKRPSKSFSRSEIFRVQSGKFEVKNRFIGVHAPDSEIDACAI